MLYTNNSREHACVGDWQSGNKQMGGGKSIREGGRNMALVRKLLLPRGRVDTYYVGDGRRIERCKARVYVDGMGM